MKRICLAGAATAALLTAGIVSVPASALPANKPAGVLKKPVVKNTRVVTHLSCNVTIATQIPSNDVTVTQGAGTGTQAGRATCGKPLYTGIEATTFLQDESGDLQGKYQQWFNSGSVYGNYTLIPEDTGPPSPDTFAAASYTGTLRLRNGTGLFKKTVGIGTIKCTTADSAHFTCTEKLKLVQTVPVIVKTKKP